MEQELRQNEQLCRVARSNGEFSPFLEAFYSHATDKTAQSWEATTHFGVSVDSGWPLLAPYVMASKKPT